MWRYPIAMAWSDILLLFFFAWPLLSYILHLLLRRRVHWCAVIAVATVSGYAMLLGSVLTYDMELDRDLSRYDLDGNGSFSEQELTPAAEQAMYRVSSDTARQFAPFTGIPITLMWVTLGCSVLLAIDYGVRALARYESQQREPHKHLAHTEH